MREHVRVLRCGDAEPVGRGLQLAVTALFTEHAEVVALDEDHVDQVASQLPQLLSVVLHDRARRYGLRASGSSASVDLDRADAAGARWRQALHPAESRDVDAGLLGGLQNALAVLALDLLAIDTKLDGVWHAETPIPRPE